MKTEAFNHTDSRIVKMWKSGMSLESIARKIGRTGDIDRVETAIQRHNKALTQGGQSSRNKVKGK